ncbi:hypothetical protein CDCA_CDCA02G0569 [Cyanidium caldarium]|uniref:Plastid lipid-associated protein/fibrillin conserved domain-containing protein n=1 Tax=Cyanidium caldarium TaxID=2771 RepID=A0AAV9IQX7_CYACA|nr:hypothetical protein CDCA_CDCA02G0569 [Cyanidium caldarium]
MNAPHNLAFALAMVRASATGTPQQPRRALADREARTAVVETLHEAAAVSSPLRRPNRAAVAAALARLDAACRRGRADANRSSEWQAPPTDQLLGEWRLVFTLNKRGQAMLKERASTAGPWWSTPGMYFPLRAGLIIQAPPGGATDGHAAAGVIRNQAWLPGRCLGIEFEGPWRFQPEHARLQFNFYRMYVHALGTAYGPFAVAGGKQALEDEDARTQRCRLPFFTFFHVDQRVLAGRGRGGGLALWAREPHVS